MGQAQPAPTRYTVEEYFALEEQSEVRREFFEGRVTEVEPDTIAHNYLAGNITIALRQIQPRKDMLVFLEDVRLTVHENRHYTYPDVMMSTDPADRLETNTIRRPLLLVEVYSPTTEAYDRGNKFTRYKTLPSLRHYVLVSQRQWAVEWYRRNEADEWVHTALTEAAEVLRIPELHLNLTLAEMYEESGVAPLRITPSESEVEGSAA